MSVKPWKERALAATRGTQFGAILNSAMGEEIEAPCFTSKGTITSDGFLMANFTGSDGRAHLGAFVGRASDLIGNARGLADHLKLDGADREELFATVRGWIATDYSNGAMKALKGATLQ
jgi:hypothetical protein